MPASALVAAATRAQNAKYVQKQPASAPRGDTSSFSEKFWAKVYSFQAPNKVADSIIRTGDKVAQTRDAVINEAKTGVKLGLTLGPLIIILGLGFYLWLMFAPKR